MKRLNLEYLGELELNSMVIDRFLISVVTNTETITGVIFKTMPDKLVFNDSDCIDDIKKVIVYDTVSNKEAFAFESEDCDNIVLGLKQNIVKYLAKEYSKEGYSETLVDVIVFQADGCYHTETNSIICIKDEYTDKDINRIVYNPSNEVCALTTSGELVPICQEDFFDIGILVK